MMPPKLYHADSPSRSKPPTAMAAGVLPGTPGGYRLGCSGFQLPLANTGTTPAAARLSVTTASSSSVVLAPKEPLTTSKPRSATHCKPPMTWGHVPVPQVIGGLQRVAE